MNELWLQAADPDSPLNTDGRLEKTSLKAVCDQMGVDSATYQCILRCLKNRSLDTITGPLPAIPALAVLQGANFLESFNITSPSAQPFRKDLFASLLVNLTEELYQERIKLSPKSLGNKAYRHFFWTRNSSTVSLARARDSSPETCENAIEELNAICAKCDIDLKKMKNTHKLLVADEKSTEMGSRSMTKGLAVRHGTKNSIIVESTKTDHVTLMCTFAAGSIVNGLTISTQTLGLFAAVKSSGMIPIADGLLRNAVQSDLDESFLIMPTESGWTSSNDYVEYFAFLQNEVERIHGEPPSASNRYLLVWDGLSCHRSIEVVKAAERHGFYFYVLPANTTSVLQVPDRGIFGQLSHLYEHELIQINQHIKRKNNMLDKEKPVRTSPYDTIIAMVRALAEVERRRIPETAFEASGFCPQDMDKIIQHPSVSLSAAITGRVNLKMTSIAPNKSVEAAALSNVLVGQTMTEAMTMVKLRDGLLELPKRIKPLPASRRYLSLRDPMLNDDGETECLLYPSDDYDNPFTFSNDEESWIAVQMSREDTEPAEASGATEPAGTHHIAEDERSNDGEEPQYAEIADDARYSATAGDTVDEDIDPPQRGGIRRRLASEDVAASSDGTGDRRQEPLSNHGVQQRIDQAQQGSRRELANLIGDLDTVPSRLLGVPADLHKAIVGVIASESTGAALIGLVSIPELLSDTNRYQGEAFLSNLLPSSIDAARHGITSIKIKADYQEKVRAAALSQAQSQGRERQERVRDRRSGSQNPLVMHNAGLKTPEDRKRQSDLARLLMRAAKQAQKVGMDTAFFREITGVSPDDILDRVKTHILRQERRPRAAASVTSHDTAAPVATAERRKRARA